jgi:hypothetical protein
VPFRAAHTPAERAEFAQPDVALTLTTLAYFYDGLSRAEFVQVMGPQVFVQLLGSRQRDPDDALRLTELEAHSTSPHELLDPRSRPLQVIPC